MMGARQRDCLHINTFANPVIPAKAGIHGGWLAALLVDVQIAQEAEVNAANALAAARDAAVAAEWDLHNAVLGVKAQVVAQYGTDADEVQALGFKKKSERKRPKRTKMGV